jgi:hypothetical protein
MYCVEVVEVVKHCVVVDNDDGVLSFEPTY